MSFIENSKEPIFEVLGIGIPGYIAPLVVFILVFVFWTMFPESTYTGVRVFGHLWPLWMPPLLLVLAWHIWKLFRQAKWWSKQETTLLELKIPRQMQKSPLAMETVFAALHRKSGEGNFWDKYVVGKFRPAYSFELVSFEGEVHFFVWCRKGMVSAVQSAFYAQYPDMQIIEVDDYALRFPIDLDRFGVWGMQYALTKADVYPIKTYVDYGLDKDPKEEYKIDPFANVLEFLSSVGKGQQVWIQMVAQVTNRDWRKDGLAEIKKIRTDALKESKTEDGQVITQLTENERRAIDAIDRNTSKLAYEVGIRGLYLAQEDKFDGTNIPGLISIYRQFNSESLNGFKPKGGMTNFNDYPWEAKGPKDAMKKSLLKRYKRRGFFRAPDVDHTFGLSVEEMATIWRIPSEAIEVPNLARIDSATADAPKDLPI